MLKRLRRAALRRDVTGAPKAALKVEFVMDDGSALHIVKPLELDGRLLMMDAEIEVEPGQTVRFIPMIGGDANQELFEFEGRVAQSWIDVLVSAYATNRYLLSVELADSPELVAAVGRMLQATVVEAPAPRRGVRRQVESHRPGLIASAFWVQTA